MNAKDLTTALRGHETVTFEIRNLGSTTYKTKEFEEAVNEIESALSRSRIRDTATEPPTEEDAGRFDGVQEQVLAMNHCGHFVSKFFEMVIRFPEKYPKWTCVPQLQEVE